MKKIIILCIFSFCIASPALARYYVDAYGCYLNVGKTAQLLGGGGALGITVIDNLSVLYRGMYAVGSKETNYFTRYFYNSKKQYSHMMHLAGMEYVLMIPVINMGWRSSIMAGYSQSRIDLVDKETNFLESVFLSSAVPAGALFLNMWKISHLRDSGFSLAAWTGLQFNILPFLAPFVDVGLHKSFYYRDLEGKSIIGINVLFGVRFIAGIQNSDY